MDLTVFVTQEHIDSGQACETQTCPLALALLSIPGITKVRVGITFCRFVHFGTTYRADHPVEAQRFVRQYDGTNIPGHIADKSVVKPFSYNLHAIKWEAGL